MYRLKESIHINAPIERCFLLSTSIPLVQRTLKMKPVGVKTSGLILEGDRIDWRGWKFGIPASHHSLITRYEAPTFFQDTMERGYFSHFQHDHQFEEIDGRTLLIDIVRFSLPLGIVGRVTAKYIVIPHVLRLLLERFQLIKRIAEGPDWERYLTSPDSKAFIPHPTR